MGNHRINFLFGICEVHKIAMYRHNIKNITKCHYPLVSEVQLPLKQEHLLAQVC
jgi:hypothetical protein